MISDELVTGDFPSLLVLIGPYMFSTEVVLYGIILFIFTTWCDKTTIDLFFLSVVFSFILSPCLCFFFLTIFLSFVFLFHFLFYIPTLSFV